MMTDKDYGLEEVHALLLDGLKEFDRICRENNIRYSLHGGALLGAVRNGKLIPWDDDLDISMKRSQFVKFRKIMKKYKGDYYLNETMTWLPRFIVKKNEKSVFIDIFLWDYISENKISQKLKINLLRMLQGTMKTHIEYERFNIFYKVLLHMTHGIGRLFRFETKLRAFNYVCEKMFTGKRMYIHRSNDSFRGVKYILDNKYMNEYRNITLEGHRFMVNKRFEEFLIMEYGKDYLTPPPVDQRRPSHQFALDDLNG